MNGVDSLSSNQECRIGYRHSHSRVSQCLASIRKLGNRRSSEGLPSFKPSKGTNLFILIILAGDIEMNPGPRFQCGLCFWLVVLRLNVPVNNFSVMSGRSHLFLGN